MKGVSKPKAEVLPDSALIPESQFVKPAPSRFTHRVRRAQPFYLQKPDESEKRAGMLAKGEALVLLKNEGDGIGQFANGNGLILFTELAGVERRSPQ